ncbi:MAG: alpha/beta hydrolase-fold protein [Bacteroidetes bacterium]|nr:alpha/beta hydrolase-fold protein [Bacteroidota bacterium]
MMKRVIIFLFVFVTALNAQPVQPVTLHHTEVIEVKSASNGNTYPIFVCLPGSYDYTKQNYPVIYMLDAYSSFGIMTEMQHLLAFDKELPEAIIVRISSEGGSKEFIYNRAQDYTPTKVSAENLPEQARLLTPTSGGGEKFLRFIKDELIPMIESKYRTEKNDRTLVGHSYGGLFCFYSLFSQPELFKRYVILSPVLLWDDHYVVKLEKKFFESDKSLNAVIYTAVGSLEAESFKNDWKDMIASIRAHNYSGLTLHDEILLDETHYTVIPFMATHGLKAVFSNPAQK